MSGKKKEIDIKVLLRLREEGKTLKEISKEMGVSIPTLSRRLAVLNHEGLLTKYRELQGLQLTALQAKILSAIDFDHIERASLIDIANALYVITKAEQSIKGKASGNVGGLLEHIQALEKQK